MNSSKVEQYWDNKVADFARLYTDRNLFNRIFRRQIYLRRAIATVEVSNIPNATVLDIGCGPGVVALSYLIDGGAKHVLAMDFAKNMIDEARTRLSDQISSGRCELVQANFMEYDFKDRKFDVVSLLGVFDYVGNSMEFFKKAADLAKHTIVASFPGGGLRMYLRRKRYTCPVYSYTRKDVLKIYQHAGWPEPILKKASGGYVTIGHRK